MKEKNYRVHCSCILDVSAESEESAFHEAHSKLNRIQGIRVSFGACDEDGHNPLSD